MIFGIQMQPDLSVFNPFLLIKHMDRINNDRSGINNKHGFILQIRDKKNIEKTKQKKTTKKKTKTVKCKINCIIFKYSR
jgi:hypothetical protein